ncbi:MAG: hypothetical protein PHE33_00720 [Bacteroidales bacterium]|nr:hypothetical protein [Bacteroidales bacterium]
MKTDQFLNLSAASRERLYLYNIFTFLKNIDRTAILKPIIAALSGDDIFQINIIVKKKTHVFFIKKLDWDSDYFGMHCYSIEFIHFEHNDYKILGCAIAEYLKIHVEQNSYYTLNVPSEDLILIQALSNTSLLLIETRLNYFIDLKEVCPPNKFNDIALATKDDVDSLRLIALKAINKYDRLHADPAFSNETADLYQAKFIEEAINGFADIVLKVTDSNDSPFGFIAGNNPIDILGSKIAKLVLAAVDSGVQRGRLMDLLMQIICILKANGADFLTTITQASNKPAIRTWEKAGFKLFQVTHLYSIKK